MTPRSPPSSGSSSLGAGGDQADHVEGADQIDLDHLAEHVERVRPSLPTVFSAIAMPAQLTRMRGAARTA